METADMERTADFHTLYLKVDWWKRESEFPVTFISKETVATASAANSVTMKKMPQSLNTLVESALNLSAMLTIDALGF
jgi:hypothetical protein